MLPEKIPDLQIAIGHDTDAGQLLKRSSAQAPKVRIPHSLRTDMAQVWGLAG